MSGTPLKFVHEGVEVLYDSNKVPRQVTVDSNDLTILFQLFSESNYHAVEMVYVQPELETICYRIFEATKDLNSKNEYTLAAYMASFLFEQFTILWNYYLRHNRHLLGTKLWQHVCRMTWNWEKANNVKVHKGTPYFFLGTTQLMQGNLDYGFLFIHNAIEEDKRFSNQISNTSFYQTMPAYLFSSLINDRRNYLYPYVLDAISKIESFRQTHNSLLSKTFSYADFETKFLKNPELEELKFFFVYTLFGIVSHDKIDAHELRNNDFSKLRNLDVIFNLCLIVDEVMKMKTGERYVSGSVKNVCENHLGLPNAHAVYDSLHFNQDFENGVRNCLNLNYQLGSQTVPKDCLLLILLWGLRNFGGHNIEANNLFVTEYSNLIQKLMSALFIILEELY